MLVTSNYCKFKVKDPSSENLLHSFEGAKKANHALPDDLVKVLEDGSVEILSRAPRKKLVGIWEITSKYIYGMNSRGNPYYLCKPLNKGYPPFLVACNSKLSDTSCDKLITFTFDSWNNTTYPRGAFDSLLGPVEDFETEKLALQIVSCPWTHGKKKLQSLEFTDLPALQLKENTFNIDPPGCKDIDDVLTILPFGENWKIYITIADVARWISQDSKEYELAMKISATTYQDGEAVAPMLPYEYSHNLCSLLPGQKRFGIALEVIWSPIQKKIISTPVFQEVYIENQKSYTYDSVYKADSSILHTLQEFTSYLAKQSLTDSHAWIEQCMVLYNKEVAKVLAKIGKGILRAHDAPFQEKRQALIAIDPNLEKLAFQSAKYVPVGSESTHYGLQTDLYCHASSPIRRFADLYNQYILKNSFLGKNSECMDTSQYLNKRQKEISNAEREYIFLKAVVKSPKAEVEGKFLWKSKEKFVFWIEEWKTTIQFKSPFADLQPGEIRKIAYYCDRREASWKQKMIFSMSSQ